LPFPAIAKPLHAQGCKESVRELQHNCKWKTAGVGNGKKYLEQMECLLFAMKLQKSHEHAFIELFDLQRCTAILTCIHTFDRQMTFALFIHTTDKKKPPRWLIAAVRELLKQCPSQGHLLRELRTLRTRLRPGNQRRPSQPAYRVSASDPWGILRAVTTSQSYPNPDSLAK
jgi:hypothetical protein